MLLVKLIEPPYTEPYVRWCERSEGEIIAFLLLDFDIRAMDTGHVYIRSGLKKSARYKWGGGMVSEAEAGQIDKTVMKNKKEGITNG